MIRNVPVLLTAVFVFSAQSAISEESGDQARNAQDSSGGDPRQLVSMPEQTQEIMRKDMVDHLSALGEIIGHLGSNDLEAAAEVAETRMGRSSMGKHRGTGMGPGRYMPVEMRKLGWGMHDAATEFSQAAKQGDVQAAYKALQKITSACVACHYSYRIR